MYEITEEDYKIIEDIIKKNHKKKIDEYNKDDIPEFVDDMMVVKSYFLISEIEVLTKNEDSEWDTDHHIAYLTKPGSRQVEIVGLITMATEM